MKTTRQPSKKTDTDDILHLIRSAKAANGLVVRSADGRVFFLRDTDVKRTAVKGRAGAEAKEVWEKQASHPPVNALSRCGKVLRWLLTHDPDSENWRRVSGWWIGHC
jgi:hypothetical protein